MRVASESPLRYKVVLRAYRETVEDSKGPHPSNGYFVGTAPEVTWDRYHWHNLVPSGYWISAEFFPNYFLGANQHRHQARLPDLQGGAHDQRRSCATSGRASPAIPSPLRRRRPYFRPDSDGIRAPTSSGISCGEPRAGPGSSRYVLNRVTDGVR